MGRSIILFTAAASILLVAGSGKAADPPGVLLLSRDECCADTAWPEAEQKIANEFTQDGYRIIVQPDIADAGQTPEGELSTAARQAGAIAAVRVFRNAGTSQSGVDLWVSDPGTRREQYRRLPITDVASTEAADVASLRTLELFHETIEDLQSTPPPSPAPTSPQAQSPPKSSDEPFHPLRLSVGFAGVFFPGDTPPLGAPVISVGWQPLRHFRLEAEAMFAFIGKDIEDGPHRASIAAHSVGLKALAVFTPHPRVHPFVGLFGGASFVRLSGQSETDAPVSDVETTAAIFGGTLGLDIPVSKHFSFSGFFDGGVQLPQTTVVLAGEEAASFGLPVLRTGLMFTAHFVSQTAN